MGCKILQLSSNVYTRCEVNKLKNDHEQYMGLWAQLKNGAWKTNVSYVVMCAIRYTFTAKNNIKYTTASTDCRQTNRLFCSKLKSLNAIIELNVFA